MSHGHPETKSVMAALAETFDEVPRFDLSAPPDDAPTQAQPEWRYHMRASLGSGGLGEVLEAFDLDLRRSVALKAPHKGYDQRSSTLLIREAQITAQLEHPGVPSVYNLGLHEDGRPFFAMAHVRGQTLTSLIRSGDFRERKMMRVFVELAYALAFAHERGVIHRDIKPDNVMIGAFGEVRLMDWGIAKLSGQNDTVQKSIELTAIAEHKTRAGSFIGTPGFAAPEQIEGCADLDARADVFALGVLLYEMLTGRALFSGSVLNQLEQTLENNRPPLTPKKEKLSFELTAIINKATRPAREDRYQTVMEMLRDVEAYLDGEIVRAFEPNHWQKMRALYRLRAARTRRLTNLDLDLIIGGHAVAGGGVGMLALYLFPLPIWSALLFFVFGLAATAVPAYTLLRRERLDDRRRESAVIAEGLQTR